jgi:hypothetical protein
MRDESATTKGRRRREEKRRRTHHHAPFALALPPALVRCCTASTLLTSTRIESVRRPWADLNLGGRGESIVLIPSRLFRGGHARKNEGHVRTLLVAAGGQREEDVCRSDGSRRRGRGGEERTRSFDGAGGVVGLYAALADVAESLRRILWCRIEWRASGRRGRRGEGRRESPALGESAGR